MNNGVYVNYPILSKVWDKNIYNNLITIMLQLYISDIDVRLDLCNV